MFEDSIIVFEINLGCSDLPSSYTEFRMYLYQFLSITVKCFLEIRIHGPFSINAALMDAIREDVSVLTLLAEALCLLDMIVNSFAHMISTKPVDRYTRPQFTGKLLGIYLLIFIIDFGYAIFWLILFWCW